jgi:hypothetical protein
MPLFKQFKSRMNTIEQHCRRFQVKSISNDRFMTKLGELSKEDLDEVKVCLAKVLDLL